MWAQPKPLKPGSVKFSKTGIKIYQEVLKNDKPVTKT